MLLYLFYFLSSLMSYLFNFLSSMLPYLFYHVLYVALSHLPCLPYCLISSTLSYLLPYLFYILSSMLPYLFYLLSSMLLYLFSHSPHTHFLIHSLSAREWPSIVSVFSPCRLTATVSNSLPVRLLTLVCPSLLMPDPWWKLSVALQRIWHLRSCWLLEVDHIQKLLTAGV